MVFVHGWIPARLQALERTTAEDICAAQLAILAELPDKSPAMSSDCLQVHIASADRYSANGAAERGIQARRHLETHLRLPCLVHMASSCASWMLAVCEEHVSALISVGLVLSVGGMMKRFRQYLYDEICRKLEVVNDAPPQGDVEAYRLRVYDLFLSLNLCNEHSKPAFRRRRAVQRAVLSRYVCGNLQDADHFFFYTQGASMTLAEVQDVIKTHIVPALAPIRVGIFPRHRWFGGEAVADALGLINSHHQILAPALLRLTEDARNVTLQGADSGWHGWDGAAQSIAAVRAQRDQSQQGREGAAMPAVQPEAPDAEVNGPAADVIVLDDEDPASEGPRVPAEAAAAGAAASNLRPS